MVRPGYRPASFGAQGANLAMLELARNYPPHSVLREYVSNAFDSHARTIRVIAYPEMRRLIIADDGEGMSYEKLDSLRDSIGFSDKRGKIDSIGEKALGILAFASAGESIHIISRDRNTDGPFGYLRMEEKNGKQIGSDFQYLDEAKAASDFGKFGFSRGTQVIIDLVNPMFMEKTFTIPAIRSRLSKLYTPRLLNGDTIRIGRVTKRKQLDEEEVPPLTFLGEKLIDINMAVEDEEGPLRLEGMLFFNPTGTSDKVHVYSKGVFVYESITDLEDLAKDRFWGCGKLTGYVNDYFNKLILGREGIDRNRRQYRLWREHISKIKESFEAEIEDRIRRGPKQKEDAFVHEAERALAGALRELNYGDNLLIRAGVTGTLQKVEGTSPTSPREPRKKPETPVNPVPRGSNGTNGGLFTPTKEGGREERVAPRHGSENIRIILTDNFKSGESSARAKIDDSFGTPIISVNVKNGDYLLRKNDEENRFRYIAAVASKVIAEAKVAKALEQRLVDNREAIAAGMRLADDIQFKMLSRLKIL